MLTDYDSRVALYLDHIKDHYKIHCKDDQVRQEIIDCVKNAGKKREDYFQAFKNIAVRIKSEWGHLIIGNSKTHEHDVGVEKVMNVSFDVEEIGRFIKRKRIVITKTEVLPYHLSRKMLLDRYPKH